PCTSTSFTASARNSGVYVVDFMISLPLTSLSNGSVRKTQVTSSAPGWDNSSGDALVAYAYAQVQRVERQTDIDRRCAR
ncbi:hypothetical protein, partial [Duganella lactea]|uniref:hypothetical protein n=1 Tax=Duganella lactea TaxID=2692173 RepID=UPI001E3AE0B7